MTHTKVAGFTVCNDCGASSRTGLVVEHYSSCIPGCSERWEQYYDDSAAEEGYQEYLVNGPTGETADF